MYNPFIVRTLTVCGLGLLAFVVGAYLPVRLAEPPQVSAQSATGDLQKAAGGRLSFEVASVKQNTSGNFVPAKFPLDDGDAYASTGGLFTAVGFPVITYIQFAYKLHLTPGEGAALLATMPKWANVSRFDIEARGLASATKDQMRLMMQSLLADRFKLAVHMKMQQGPVFALVLDKPRKVGSKLIPHSQGPPCDDNSQSTSASNAPRTDVFPAACDTFAIRMSQGGVLLASRNTTIERVARVFGTLPGEGVIDRPVVDKTGLAGNFDFTLEFRPDAPVSMNGSNMTFDESVPTFLEALKDQLGMKLKAETGPVQTITVDHIEEPSPN
ncbi:MAG: TIGR03435 family protein [Candidatus Acidiferrales bacterium]